MVEWFDGLIYPPEDIRRLYSKDLKDYPTESAMVVGTEGALLMEIGHNAILLPDGSVQADPLPNRVRRAASSRQRSTNDREHDTPGVAHPTSLAGRRGGNGRRAGDGGRGGITQAQG